MELNKIYQMDCIEGMKQIPDKSIDMILTDLPYGTTSNKWDIVIPLDKMWERFNRIIKGNGAIVLTASQPFTTDLINSNRKMFRYELIWEKSIGYNPLLCKKQPLKTHENILIFYKDLSEVKYSTENYKELRKYFEEILLASKKTKKELINKIGQRVDHCLRYKSSQWSLPTKETYEELVKLSGITDRKEYAELLEIYERENVALDKFTYNPQMRKGIKRDKKPGMRGVKEDRNWKSLKKFKGKENINDDYYPRSVNYFPNANQKEKDHPTQKPLELFEYLIKTYSNEGETILDSCMGSGTTAVAAMKTNRNFIGFEIESEYIQIAQKRIADTKELMEQGDLFTLDNN